MFSRHLAIFRLGPRSDLIVPCFFLPFFAAPHWKCLIWQTLRPGGIRDLFPRRRAMAAWGSTTGEPARPPMLPGKRVCVLSIDNPVGWAQGAILVSSLAS